jgi:SAM-dependent methyltransferase
MLDREKEIVMDEIKIKAVIQKKYAESAKTGGCGCSSPVQDAGSGCCGSGTGVKISSADEAINTADLGLSCGLPVRDAGIRPGDQVLDLGSGAGVDVFRAAKIVGEEGFVTGVDMTPEMIAQARKNAVQGGYQNVAFRLGEIEHLPVPDASQDVVISNCVINLVPDKRAAFAEIYRVLKHGGRFCISDIVTHGKLPESLRQDLEAWAACVSGAVEKQVYLEMLVEAGFQDVKIVRGSNYGSTSDESSGLESITVVGNKA